MATIMIFHEVNDGTHWANAWKKGPGSRHEMFAKYGAKARTFQDATNPNITGLIVEVPDFEKFLLVIETEEGKNAMAEDGLKIETVKFLTEFTP
jgi:hypothetical protein